MKRLLYWVGIALIMAVTFTASLRWPEFVIWVAWMLAALLWFSASVLGGEAEEAKRSRDRWAVLARKAEAEVDRLQKQLEKRQAEVENLRGAIDKFAELVDTRNAEIGRLRQQLQLDPLRIAEARQAASEAEARLEIQAAEIERLKGELEKDEEGVSDARPNHSS